MSNLGHWSRGARPRCASGAERVDHSGRAGTDFMKPFTPLVLLFLSAAAARGDDWAQLQGNALRSGNAPAATVKTPLGLVGAVPLTDGIYAAPVVADGKVIVVDGAGVVVALDAQTLKELWRFATKGGAGN